jgi:hypothetical protein
LASAALLVPLANARPAAKFTSKVYGYSITLPGQSSRWNAHPAIVAWTGTSIGGIGSPSIDTFSDQSTGRSYLLAARRTSSTLGEWTQFVTRARANVCQKPRPVGSSNLGGAAARVVTWSCSDGYRVYVIAALHAKRGYFMLVASPTALSRASDLRALAEARKGFRFRS